MNEFGEEFTIYVWPKGHEEYTPYPDDMWGRIRDALDNAGFDCEIV